MGMLARPTASAKRRGSCEGKTGFGNRKHALETATKIANREGVRLHVYRCPKCKMFHFTSKPKWWWKNRVPVVL